MPGRKPINYNKTKKINNKIPQKGMFSLKQVETAEEEIARKRLVRDSSGWILSSIQYPAPLEPEPEPEEERPR